MSNIPLLFSLICSNSFDLLRLAPGSCVSLNSLSTGSYSLNSFSFLFDISMFFVALSILLLISFILLVLLINSCDLLLPSAKSFLLASISLVFSAKDLLTFWFKFLLAKLLTTTLPWASINSIPKKSNSWRSASLAAFISIPRPLLASCENLPISSTNCLAFFILGLYPKFSSAIDINSWRICLNIVGATSL